MEKNNTQQATAHFSDMMKSFINPEMFLGSVKHMPKIGLGSCTATMKKNTEMLSATNQLFADNTQSVVKHSTDAIQKNAASTYDTVKEILSAENIEQAAASHQRYVKETIENSMNNAKEIMDMTSKTLTDAFQLYGDHMSCCMSSVINNKCATQE